MDLKDFKEDDLSDNEDMPVEGDGGDDEEQATPLAYDEESPNLVPVFAAHPDGKEWLKKAADEVCENFDSAWESTEDYRGMVAQNFKIYAGKMPKRSYPYDNMPNPHVPILLEGATRLGSRLFAELFGERGNIFGVMPTGPDDAQIAELLTVHGNWQLRNDIPDFFRQQHRGIMLFFTAGDVTCESFYDPERRQNRHEMLTSDDFVTPYMWTSTMPDWSDAPFLVKVLRLQKHQIRARAGEWDEDAIDRVIAKQAPSWDDEPEGKLREAVAETTGVTSPDDGKGAPYILYQYHGWMALPGIKQVTTEEGDEGIEIEDERERYVCIVVCPKTRNVLRVYVDEDYDWKDRLRFENQQKELAGFQQAQADFQGMQDEAAQIQTRLQTPVIQTEDPMADEADMQARQMAEQRLGQLQLAVPPEPPGWLDPENPQPPAPPRKVPNCWRFSHGVCIENPLGNNGLSYGNILADFNRSADNHLTMFSDAAVLANQWGIIAPDTLDIDKLEIAPGKVNKVTGMTADDLRKSIIELKPSPANQQLVDLVNMSYQWGQSAVSAPNVLSGEPGKSGETYRGISTRIEQAMKQLTVAGQKYADFVTQTLRNNAQLNSKFLPEDEILYVNDHVQGIRELKMSRRLYERDYRVTIMSDLRFTSQAQRIQEADELIGLKQMVPTLANNVAFDQQAVIRRLRAMGVTDMIPFLGPQLPPPSTPMGMLPPPPPGMAPPGATPGPGGPPPPENPAGTPPGPGGPVNAPPPGTAPG